MYSFGGGVAGYQMSVFPGGIRASFVVYRETCTVPGCIFSMYKNLKFNATSFVTI